MTNILAIDPGADTCANAVFQDGLIVHTEFSMTPGVAGLVLQEIVVERMQADERTRHVDVRHVLACQFNGALCAGFAAGRHMCPVVWYTPTEWKGTEPKPINHRRLWDVLTPAERAVLGGDATLHVIDAAVEKGALRRWASNRDPYPRKFVLHNILDAASLGAVHLGRMEKR